jgi:hypothetical protein
MDFVSFCNVYQDIDAALLLYQEKKEKEKERKRDRNKERKKYLVVATSPSA